MKTWKNEQECFDETLFDELARKINFEQKLIISEIKEKLSAEELTYLYYILDRVPVNAIKQKEIGIYNASCEEWYQQTTEPVRLICDLIINRIHTECFNVANAAVEAAKFMDEIEDRQESDEP